LEKIKKISKGGFEELGFLDRSVNLNELAAGGVYIPIRD
jgi:hypothetical protein